VITLITGAPGSGKTAACVELLMRFEQEGRAIFVDGIPDLAITHLELEDPHKWHVDIPDGAVIVIDEAQRVWRPAGSGSAVPDHIAALETHRHKGIEFVVMTQHPNLIHANVRRLVGRHIHLRDLGFLGRHWYEWPECANPESWKNALVKKRYKLPRKTFRMYKSASLHVKPVRSVPRSLIMFAICVPLVLFLGHRVYARISSFTADKPEAKGVAKLAGKSVDTVVTPKPERLLPGDVPAAGAAPAPEPVKLVGCIHLGKRCECLNESGFSITVELHLCTGTASRGGIGVPYDIHPVQAAKHSAPKPTPPLQAKPKPAPSQASL
jgi:zona occludens toxin